MDNSKNIKHINLNEGESPEENDILDDLQMLVDTWRKDNLETISPIVSLQRLIDDYYSKPLNEMVGGDQEWHTKEQGEFFTLDGSENLGNTDYFKDDGFDIIHQTPGHHHLSDISPESEQTYVPKGSKKVKKTVLKPRLEKGPFNVNVLDESATSIKQIEGDNLLGGKQYVWNPDKKIHQLQDIKLPKERFYHLVKAISGKHPQDTLETLTKGEYYKVEDALNDTLKLYGIGINDLGGARPEGLLYKLLFASLDNHEGLNNNEITNFDSLKLRPLKKYKVQCREEVTRDDTFQWEPIVLAYTEESAAMIVQENEDGEFSHYEWEHEPGYKQWDDGYDSHGMEITNVEEIENTPTQLTESHHLKEYTIDSIGGAIMNHLRRDYSNVELENLRVTNSWDLPDSIKKMMKLYGWTQEIRIKMLLEFMKEYNYEQQDYKKFVGEILDAPKTYTFTKTYEEDERHVKSATIDITDTNYESALCSATNEFWDWEPQEDYLETLEQDYVGNEEWEFIEIDGSEVWRVGGPDNPFNPINREC